MDGSSSGWKTLQNHLWGVWTSTIKRTLISSGLHSRAAMRKGDITAHLQSAEDHRDKHRLLENVLWTDETKIDLFWFE
uniref:Transposase Tc1-like domain-containing protein n=1 Tax=Stegastes partitus TaxID=144197 RepID=A0A3B4ZNV6_9TELE